MAFIAPAYIFASPTKEPRGVGIMTDNGQSAEGANPQSDDVFTSFWATVNQPVLAGAVHGSPI